MISKRSAATVGAIVLTAALSGACGRNVDTTAVGGEAIPGAGSLHVFCDRFGTLVYYTVRSGGEDEYEAFFAQACVPGTRPIVSTAQVPVNPRAVQTPEPRTWTPDGDLGNTQPGTESENK